MTTAAALRAQIEAALVKKVPSALTPQPRIFRLTAPTGIPEIDQLLQGGLPIGALSEIVGPESSGRTSLALAFVARLTQAGKVCAWIDVSDSLHPESAASIGVDLARLLWIRCGVFSRAAELRYNRPPEIPLPEKYTTPPPVKKGLHGGGFGPHPRTEIKGLSTAVSDLLRTPNPNPRCVESIPKPRPERERYEQQPVRPAGKVRSSRECKPWTRMDQALRATDLLVQGGGFSCLVLDMGSIAAEYASRVPLATWYRFRTAAERTQMSFLLLTQHACAKNSAGVVLRLDAANALAKEATLFTGMAHSADVARQRFIEPAANVVSLRKPPQRVTAAQWQSRTTWTERK
jgi:recombination protein RecA